MADITLNAEIRAASGSRRAGRLRAEGKLPAVLYGKGMAPLSISLDHHDLSKALQTKESRATEMTLMVGATPYRVKLQAVQRHPLKGVATHLDFLVV